MDLAEDAHEQRTSHNATLLGTHPCCLAVANKSPLSLLDTCGEEGQRQHGKPARVVHQHEHTLHTRGLVHRRNPQRVVRDVNGVVEADELLLRSAGTPGAQGRVISRTSLAR